MFEQPNRYKAVITCPLLTHIHTTRQTYLRSGRLGRHHHDIAGVMRLGWRRVGLVLRLARVVRGRWLVSLLGWIVGHGSVADRRLRKYGLLEEGESTGVMHCALD